MFPLVASYDNQYDSNNYIPTAHDCSYSILGRYPARNSTKTVIWKFFEMTYLNQFLM